MTVSIALRFWHARNDARTVLIESTPQDNSPASDEDSVTIEGELVDGDGVLAPGHVSFFVPLRSLIWMVTRPKDEP